MSNYKITAQKLIKRCTLMRPNLKAPPQPTYQTLCCWIKYDPIVLF